MPTQKTITVYQYSELSDAAKERARNWYIEASAGDSFAWENTKEDAENIGLKLLGTDRGRMTGEFLTSAAECAEKIMSEHGEACETYKTAAKFLAARKPMQEARANSPDDDLFEDEISDLDREFLRDICEDYRIMYEKDEEYQISEEVISDTMAANEYEFLENGKRA